MKLSTTDKIIITKSLIPESGTIEDVKLMISIKNKLLITNEELAIAKISIPSANMLQLNNITAEMQERNIEYDLTASEIEFLKRHATNCSLNGWVTEFSLDTIEMLINYTE